MTRSKPQHAFETQSLHAGKTAEAGQPLVQPIYQSSTFVFDDVASGAALFRHEAPGFIYTRLGNPNQELLASRISALEGFDLLQAEPDAEPGQLVDGRVFSSGMAAVSAAILSRCKSGDLILAQEGIYSATLNWLNVLGPRYGIEVKTIAETESSAWEQAFDRYPNARLAYIETPANPTLQILDIKRIAEMAHARGAWLAVDNTFATPYCQRPLTLGADVVVHSLTKYLCGHAVVIGGAVISRHPEFVKNELQQQLTLMGAALSPFDSWLTLLGLKTFALRMQKHCQNAGQIARYLKTHPAVERVFYPGLESHPGHSLAGEQMHAFGGMIAFELKGGYEAGEELMNHVRLCTLTVSLGDVDTLICHPASMTHSTLSREQRIQSGISDGLIRFSVGIENVDDLIADLDQALG